MGTRETIGAGIFGARTRDRLKEILAFRDYTHRIIAEASKASDTLIAKTEAVDEVSGGFVGNIIAKELDYGTNDPEVKKLQQFLKDEGYFSEDFFSNFFGPVTSKAVLDFQLANSIVSSEFDVGAGRVGPSTLAKINNWS